MSLTPFNVSDLINTMLPLVIFIMIFQMLIGIVKEFRTA
jgi:hypothetical protein